MQETNALENTTVEDTPTHRTLLPITNSHVSVIHDCLLFILVI